MSAYSAQPSTQSLMAKHTIIPSLGIQTQCKGHGVVSISDAFIQIQWFLVDVQFERVLSSTWDIRVSPERHQKPIEPEKRSQEMGNKSYVSTVSSQQRHPQIQKFNLAPIAVSCGDEPNNEVDCEDCPGPSGYDENW